jgi:large subunit ribosomal protein L17
MYKRVKTKKLGRTHSHRKALVLNMLRSIVKSGSVKTTTPKAKVLKNEVESLLAKVKNTKDGDLALRRKLQTILGDSESVKKLLEVKDTSVVVKKVGFRSGDNSEISVVEIKGLKGKKAKVSGKKEVSKKDVEVEEKTVPSIEEPKKRNILDLGRKSVKKATSIKKERAKSRSGL